jgi:dodecin
VPVPAGGGERRRRLAPLPSMLCSSFLLKSKEGHLMSDPVYRKSEFVGTSTTSFHDAAANAVDKADQQVHHMSWFEVVEQRGNIVDGKIQQYQVTIRIGHRVD